MARIEHRRFLPERGGPGSTQAAAMEHGWRRLDLVGRIFLVLAVVGLGLGLWRVVFAALAGDSGWTAAIPRDVMADIREASLVALPAAVALGRPRGARGNELLRKGAIIVATFQLLRGPVSTLAGMLINGELDSTLPEGWPGVLVVVVPAVFAILYAAGVWALAEGLRDAGGRATRGVAAIVFVAIVGVEAASWVPGLVQVVPIGGLRPLDILSLGLSLVLLVPQALLIARAISGARSGVDPHRAWLVGAAGLAVLTTLRVISMLQVIASQLRPADAPSLDLWFLGFAIPLGWPLFVVGVAMGMGRLGGVIATAPYRRHVIGASPRFVPVPADGAEAVVR